MIWPRLGRPWGSDFWTCPQCSRPAKLWPIWLCDAPYWRCEVCKISGRLDSGASGVAR